MSQIHIDQLADARSVMLLNECLQKLSRSTRPNFPATFPGFQREIPLSISKPFSAPMTPDFKSLIGEAPICVAKRKREHAVLGTPTGVKGGDRIHQNIQVKSKIGA